MKKVSVKDHPVHELGTNARVLLSSVFGPYAQDDHYGSRVNNPMELYHNQVTRVQGVFSLRMFHPSLGLKMIQENIDAPCTHLDFPSLDRFIEEIKDNTYDIVGISAIIPNIGKVQKMCQLIREYQPSAAIVVGGHVANIPEIEKLIDADYIVRGEGIQWFRKFLGQDPNMPIRHPAVLSGFGGRTLGISLPMRSTAAVVIPSVGCPMGCNFCSTSALFGGKGKFINFFETGEELFNVLCDLEDKLGVHSFFIMDENFLFHKKRAFKLLELMEKHNKSWAFSIFSSARVIKGYTDEQLVALGISWIWIGLEGKSSQYNKLDGVDTRELVKRLQSLGIKVLGSTIIGLEDHTPENIGGVIDWAVSHNTDFHQCMLYTPNCGTPLYKQLREEGRIMSQEECLYADSHGQERFNYHHKAFKNREETQILLNAFQRDFDVNGPSIMRLFGTIVKGYKKFKNHPDKRIRERYTFEARLIKKPIATGVLKAMKKWYKDDKKILEKIKKISKRVNEETGILNRMISPFVAIWVYRAMKSEEKRLKEGWTYEPGTLYSKNEKALELEKNGSVNYNIPGKVKGKKAAEVYPN